MISGCSTNMALGGITARNCIRTLDPDKALGGSTVDRQQQHGHKQWHRQWTTSWPRVAAQVSDTNIASGCRRRSSPGNKPFSISDILLMLRARVIIQLSSSVRIGGRSVGGWELSLHNSRLLHTTLLTLLGNCMLLHGPQPSIIPVTAVTPHLFHSTPFLHLFHLSIHICSL